MGTSRDRPETDATELEGSTWEGFDSGDGASWGGDSAESHTSRESVIASCVVLALLTSSIIASSRETDTVYRIPRLV
jgi:hypothetical protein